MSHILPASDILRRTSVIGGRADPDDSASEQRLLTQRGSVPPRRKFPNSGQSGRNLRGVESHLRSQERACAVAGNSAPLVPMEILINSWAEL